MHVCALALLVYMTVAAPSSLPMAARHEFGWVFDWRSPVSLFTSQTWLAFGDE